MIRLAADEAIAADVVVSLDAFDHVDREGQAGDPGGARSLIGQIEFGGRRVLDDGFGAEIVGHASEQMGLTAAHQIDIPQGAPLIGRHGGGPHEAGGAAAQKIGY